MTEVYTLQEIKSALNYSEIIEIIAQGFVLYSQGKTVVPPVGYLGFENPPADVHIKYGYIKDDDFYVIKIASGFYENPKINLPSSNGLMLVFSQKTGELSAVLLDEGFLTDIRTAAAGAVAAKYLAQKNVDCIGIIGCGVQGRLQFELLKEVINCRKAIVWGRNQEKLDKYGEEMSESGFEIETTTDISEITQNCQLIVTTTPSKTPLIFAEQIKKGTHITAVGADAEDKQELEAQVFDLADILVADSISQCLHHGDLSHSNIAKEKVIELGDVISNPDLQRKSGEQITVADLTGVAVQDIQIAKYVFQKLRAI